MHTLFDFLSLFACPCQLREGSNGVFVENLTEVAICTVEEVACVCCRSLCAIDLQEQVAQFVIYAFIRLATGRIL